MLRAEGVEETVETMRGVSVRVTSYQIGDRFFAKIDNINPGAILGRAWGEDRETAVERARTAANESWPK